ncbi:Myc-type basic helix-loop-helix (bHLH) domain [Trinorchestia longiramus]|nr:Myc-type basic helix-loop-helix (bHLH) domain [Trinorchestia longiramus]
MASKRKGSARALQTFCPSSIGGAAHRVSDGDVSSTQSPEQLVLAAADSSASWTDSSAAGACSPDSGGATATKKTSSKPQTERRRRQRINQCVGLLKSLVLEAMGKDPSQYTKLEKADVLDMAVRYVQTLREQQQLQQLQQQQQELTTPSTNTVFSAAAEAPTKIMNVPGASENTVSTAPRLFDSPLLLYNPTGNGNYNETRSLPQPTSPQYHAGFSQCSSEIELYLRMLKNVPGDLPDKVASHLNNLLSKIKVDTSENIATKEPTKFTGIPPSMQPILLLLNPISTTPIPTVQMVGPLTSESHLQVPCNAGTTPLLQERSSLNSVKSNEELPQESLPLHSNGSQLDASSLGSSTPSCQSTSSRNTPSTSMDGNTTPSLSPCHSVMSDKSSVGYFYFSDEADQTASPETVTMYRCDESFSTDTLSSEPQNGITTPATSFTCPQMGPSNPAVNATFPARKEQCERYSSVSHIDHVEDNVQPSCSSRQRCNSNSSENRLRGSHAESLHSRAVQEGELSTMWRPWYN